LTWGADLRIAESTFNFAQERCILSIGKNSPAGKTVVLVSTPWPIFSRPSIQLATLKAYLKAEHPEIDVVAYHAYLEIAAAVGYRVYQEISQRTWLAEPLYAALLYPRQTEAIERLFRRYTRGNSILKNVEFSGLLSKLEMASRKFIASVAWDRCLLVGFSICLCQLTSSLYFIERVKALDASLPVVVGGSMFAGDAIQPLLQHFPAIDYAVNGEGELPLSGLVKQLLAESPDAKPQEVPGLAARVSGIHGPPLDRNQLQDLSRLPAPDFDDYFFLLKRLGPDGAFVPTIAVEMSRGCWWRRRHTGRLYCGCAFCNLNLQWEGYRIKSVEQTVGEIEQLTTRHQTLSVAFMDNLIPLKEAALAFDTLAAGEKDLALFCEVRAAVPADQLARMKQAGVKELQVGIEALSTGLLDKMNKGTRTIDNIQIMRDCEEVGLIDSSNLILQFPGSDADDVEETLRNLEFVLPYRPLRCVRFWLGLESPVWRHFRSFGLRSRCNHPHWSVLFPPAIARNMHFPIQAYRGDLGRQRKLWQPVAARVRQWAKAYAELRQDSFANPILFFQDGRDFLLIRQRRHRQETLNHRLNRISREVYLHCRQQRSLDNLRQRFPQIAEDRLRGFLGLMVEKKLMFQENDRFLSLAVAMRRRTRC
jgi:ribosomal peptide maturation radical SAM protein 1